MTNDQIGVLKGSVVVLGALAIGTVAAGLVIYGVNDHNFKNAIYQHTEVVKNKYDLVDYDPEYAYLTYFNNQPTAKICGTINVGANKEQVGFEYIIPCSTQAQRDKYDKLIDISKTNHYVDLDRQAVCKVVEELTTLVYEETATKIYGNYSNNDLLEN